MGPIFRLLCTLGAVSLVAMQAAAQGMPNYDTESYCRRLSGGSYALENTCRSSEENDREFVQRANISPEIWRYCLNLMRSSESYSLLKACINSEERAKATQPPSNSRLVEVPTAMRPATTAAPAAPRPSTFAERQAALAPSTTLTLPKSGQSGFIDAVGKSRDEYKNAENDMAKGAARVERKRQICAALPSLRIENWEGTVYSLSSNGDGKGVIELTIGPDTYVKTWNNVLSDIGDQTLIDPSSTVFKNAVSLKKGDRVLFSGEFVRSDTDCVREASLTMAGSMQEPEFIFRFSDIRVRR